MASPIAWISTSALRTIIHAAEMQVVSTSQAATDVSVVLVMMVTDTNVIRLEIINIPQDLNLVQ